jgi:hypothetical protein
VGAASCRRDTQKRQHRDSGCHCEPLFQVPPARSFDDREDSRRRPSVL